MPSQSLLFHTGAVPAHKNPMNMRGGQSPGTSGPDPWEGRMSHPPLGPPRAIDRRRPDRRALFLAEISRTLFENLDYEATLAKVAQLAMPELGAWCIVDLISPEMEIRRVAVFHPDPEFQPITAELQKYPPASTDLFGAPRIIRTQQPELMPEVNAESVQASSHDQRHFEILCALGICTCMVVPLKARGRLLGAITFIGADRDQRYTPKDLLLPKTSPDEQRPRWTTRGSTRRHSRNREAVAAAPRATLADRAKTVFGDNESRASDAAQRNCGVC